MDSIDGNEATSRNAFSGGTIERLGTFVLHGETLHQRRVALLIVPITNVRVCHFYKTNDSIP